jgi:YesN/AraC family two-component response regulator
MEIVKTQDFLSQDIICEHKIDYFAEDFFHNHDGYELFLYLNGNINYYVEQQGQHMSTGSLVCIKPYDFHRRELLNLASYERIIINIRDSVMEKLSSDKTDLSTCFYRLPASSINILQLDEQELGNFIYLAHRLMHELTSDEFGNDILTECYLKQILVMINQLACHHNKTKIENIIPRLVIDTMAYIEKHISEDITLDILAKEIHHNGTYISRKFKEITGLPLQIYIIRKRVTLAKSYLSEGYSPIDTCFLSGFNDYSNFSRTFSKQAGLSPKKYQLQKVAHKLPDNNYPRP